DQEGRSGGVAPSTLLRPAIFDLGSSIFDLQRRMPTTPRGHRHRFDRSASPGIAPERRSLVGRGAVNPRVFLPGGLPVPACRPALAIGPAHCPGAAFLMYVQ